MVARWLRGLALLELALLAGGWLAAYPHAPGVAAMGTLVLLCSGPLWLGLQFAAMCAVQRRQGQGAPAPGALWRAWRALLGTG